MGLLDRWMNRLLGDKEEPTTTPASPPTQMQVDSLGRVDGGIKDPLDDVLDAARSRLTLDDAGRRYAQSAEFAGELLLLDNGGRSKAADGLLADALLVSPSEGLRRRLAERLLHRGDREGAKHLLQVLRDTKEHNVFALLQLGSLAEQDSDERSALHLYEQVLANDIRHPQALSRARVLRRSLGTSSGVGQKTRNLLTRFLGARAAGSRYAVLEEIGRGGAATVFRARDRVMDREVALKIFHPRGRAADRRERIRYEARIAGAFDHPHIAPILDVDTERDLLVMGLCAGGSLRAKVAKGRLAVREVGELGSVLLRTLGDVHLAGQVHLDVKPSNLLFHDDRLMLCDFGTAGMRELGAAAGTRAYMAPEQRRGAALGPSADLFATGLVLAECLMGHLPPLDDEGRVDIRLDSLPEGPRKRGMRHVLRRLTAPQPEQRPQDAHAIADGWLEATALPVTEKEGEALLARVESLAERKGPAALARMAQDPLIQALQPPPQGP